MMEKTNLKRLALISLLLILAVGISGCLAKPDALEDLPDDPDQVILPFATVTPSPSLPPVDPNAGDGAPGQQVTGEDGGALSTTAPTPTILLITATPSQIPMLVYSPGASTATPVPTDDGTLRDGSQGQAVKNLQQRLKDLGYYTGTVDGTFGAGTASALKAFQSANGLTVDGVAGSRTLSVLNSSTAIANQAPTSTDAVSGGSKYATSRPALQAYTPSTPGTYRYLQLGGSGTDVTNLQNRLKELGYFYGTANGTYGEDTKAAVETFQRRNGEWVDGIAGPDTQEALFSASALENSAATTQGSGSAASTGYQSLTNGASGEEVTKLQTRLAELGYFTEKVDGSYGTTTANAVKTFQTINGLTADGVAGTATQVRMYGSNALYAPTTEIVSVPKTTATLELGSVGEEVYRLQERLYELGYYADRIDGVYSEAVVSAVRDFQKANKLTVDGKAGRTTQTKIYASTAVKAASSEENAYATLRQGDIGERVRALQGLLVTYGYYAAEAVNGTYDAVTMLAVQAFQAQNSLTADGVAGPATLQLLYQGTPKSAAVATETQKQSATTYVTLKQGADSPDVTMLQQFLQELGYLHDDADGVFGASTLLAVQAFQSRNNLNPDGVAGQETLELIYSGTGIPAEGYGQQLAAETPDRTTIKEGDEGQDVFTMQERLKLLGYLSTEPDGKYGSGTASAVRLFQMRNGLTSDGVAGPETVKAMYAAGVVAAEAVQGAQVATVSNRDRELEEQSATGAIQGSLAGGGVAASYNSNIYYAGRGGTLYRISGSSDKQIFNGPTSYIHVSEDGVTFLSNNKVLRVPTGGGNSQVLASGKDIKKLSVIRDTLYYLEGTSLIKSDTKGTQQTLATDVKDFVIAVAEYEAYMATSSGVKRVGLNGNGEELLVSTSADQVVLGGDRVFFRSGGDIYRIENGVGVLLLEADASWMSIYREMIYYISGGKLYRCDTAGLNNKLFYDGTTVSVSFVSGKAYITEKKGGEVAQIIAVE